MKPFFSIIIPTYNRKNFLKIAINSALSQTFTDFELLVIDDGSTDKTKDLVKSLKDKRIRYIHQKHSGVSSARNKGIAASRAEWICFLDSDDRFCINKLEITYNHIKKYPEYSIFHTQEAWYRNGKLLSEKKYQKKPTGFVFKDVVKLCCVSPSTVVIKKSVFKKCGYFDENLPACEDYDFWLRISLKFPIFLIPECLTIKQGGHICQQSKKFPSLDKFRIYALEKILKASDLSNDNYNIAYNELVNKCTIYTEGAAKRGKTKEVNHYINLIKKLKK